MMAAIILAPTVMDSAIYLKVYNSFSYQLATG